MSKDLTSLLSCSSSSRSYFISLPVWLQIELHDKHTNIRSAEQLRLVSDILLNQADRL